MSQVIEMPVWGLVTLLLVAWGTAWVNAWFAMRLVRRNGMLSAPLEQVQAERARRELRAIRGEEGVLPEELEGRVIE